MRLRKIISRRNIPSVDEGIYGSRCVPRRGKGGSRLLDVGITIIKKIHMVSNEFDTAKTAFNGILFVKSVAILLRKGRNGGEP